MDQTSTPLLRNHTLPSPSEVVQEIKQLYAIALPMIINGLLIFGKSVISMYFLGRIGKSELAGGSLSMAIANITGYSVISGLSMGMDPIASQAYGAHNFSLMVQTLHRTITILLTSTIPMIILFLNAKSLLFARQDQKTADLASTYLLFSIPSLVLQCFINPLKIYLRTRNVTLPLKVGSVLALIFHAAMNCLVFWLGYGFEGVAMSVVVTDIVFLSSLLVYLFSMGDISVISFKLRGCFTMWKPILWLAIPSCMSVCLEWWFYELMIYLSGFLPNATEAISTMGILLQATSFIYIFPSSLSLAVSARVGSELGANRPCKARFISLIALSCGFVTSFIAVAFTIASQKVWGYAFTKDTTVISLTTTMMPVVGLCELGNCPQTTICGVLRGCARPSLGAYINLGSFYVIGLSMAVLMGFMQEMGLSGLWMGLLLAQVACLFLMLVSLWKTDWEVEADRAQEMIKYENLEE